jgi:tRNA-splicing ligase RtcB
MHRLFGVQSERQTLLTCVHNHVRREPHGGEHLLVHRKGAISAAPGEPGIIPGSMGSPSFHVAGRGCPDALGSSSHGAGRARSRSEARHLISVRELRRQMRGVWFDHRLATDLVEEAPGAYKDIGEVMRAQHDLTKI